VNDHLHEYRFLFANMTHGAFFQNADGSLDDVNPAALAMFGLSHDQFTGRTSRHPDWRVMNEDGSPLLPEQHPSMAALLSGERVTDFVAGVFNPQQQEYVWLQIDAIPMFRPGETLPYRVFVTLIDITLQKRTTAALAASEERYRAIVNTQTEFVNRFLPGGIITFVNDTLCRYAGIPRDELLGTSFFRFVHADDLEPLQQKLAALTPQQPSVDTKSRVVLPDGNVRRHCWTNTAIFDSAGRVCEYQSVGRDVTEQKLAEDSLERSERLFREFFNMPLVGAAITTPTKGWLAVNEKLCAILGYPKDELVRMTWSELTHPDDLAADVAQFDRVMAGELDGYVMEKRYIRKDGTIIWATIAAQCFRDHSGAVEYFAGLVQDITDRKKGLEALAYVNECFTQTLNGSQHILYRMNVKQDRYDYLSPSSEKIHGIPYEEGLQYSLDMVMQRIHPEDRVRISAEIDAALKARTANSVDLELEYRLRKTDGDYCWLHDSTTLIVDDNGEPDFFFGSAYDITERKWTEELLQASEERFRSLMDLSPDIISIIAEDGTLAYNSPAALAIHGYTQEEMVGRNTFSLIHPDDQPLCLDYTEKIFNDLPRPISVQYRYLNKDGSYVWMEATAANQLANPHIRGLIVISRDISERKRNDEMLRQSEDRFRRIIEQSPISMAVVSLDGTIEYINACAIDTFGYLPEEIPHMNDWWVKAYPDPVYREQVVTQWMGLVEKAMGENGYIERREYQATCKDGAVKTMLIFGVLVGGKVFVMFEDITERKLMEVSLRASEERYRRFIATAYEGIGIADRDYRITYVNDRLAEMLGFESCDLIGLLVNHLVSAEELDTFAQAKADHLTGTSSQREYRLRRKDGSFVWLLTSSTPIFDSAGTFQGCFAMFTDMTERKIAEDALQKAHSELENRVAERTAALAVANAQIKQMSFQLIRAEEQERARIAAELHDRVGQALLLAKMKLDMLASDSPADRERQSAEDVAVLLENSIHDIRTLTFGLRPPLLDTAGIEAALEWLCTSLHKDYRLQVDFRCGCRPLKLAGEKSYALYQSIRELLLNVVKHAGVDRAELSCRPIAGRLVVHVADNGDGFDQSAEQSRRATGGGIGLFNVQQRIEQLGGSFAIASSGQGTFVTLTMPLDTDEGEKPLCV
jgi:PAS domain S-box-containing protein